MSPAYSSAPMTSFAGKRVLVTGSSGFVGKNLVPLLINEGADLVCPSRSQYDLLEQEQVRKMFADVRPEVVFHLAAEVGGILANRDRPADFCYRNLFMGSTVMHEAWQSGVQRYVTLIGGCSYPATAPSPIKESALWEGYPQPESAPYSLAKAMSVELAKSYRKQHGFDAIVLVPGNIYGPYDNFSLTSSHVIPALIRKFTEARREGKSTVEAWGTGSPKRDFVYVGDACAAILRAAKSYSGPEIINLSSGTRTTIRNLVETVACLCGFTGTVEWDATKPDGQMDKGFDVTRMKDWLGFECSTSLEEGLRLTIDWFKENEREARRD